MKKLYLAFCLILISACQKEKCFTFIETTTNSTSHEAEGYPNNNVIEFTTCGITKNEANKLCGTSISQSVLRVKLIIRTGGSGGYYYAWNDVYVDKTITTKIK